MTKPKLLLVEDDGPLAELLTWHFEREGYTIVRTGDGEEVRSVFEIADEAAYSGKHFATHDLKRWHQFVRSKLQHIALL